MRGMVVGGFGMALAAPALAQLDARGAPTSDRIASLVAEERPAVTTGPVGPGDTLSITVYGQGDMSAQVTLDADGEITVPYLGALRVGGLPASVIGRRIADGLRDKGLLRDPQVGVEVLRMRSRIASILGEVARPGRYALDGRVSLLELLAMAGGLRDGAGDIAVVMRKGADPDAAPARIEVNVNTRSMPLAAVQDQALQPGDVVYVAPAPRFFVYGEVVRGGAFPMEAGMTVMRALALAGGVTARGSERRIDLHRVDPATGKLVEKRVERDTLVQPGDVIRVDERLF